MLLGGTVDAAADFAEVVGVEHDDFAPRIVARECIGGDGVGFLIAELGGDDGAVADVVIDVRRHKIIGTDPSPVRLWDHVDVETGRFEDVMRFQCRLVKWFAGDRVIRQIDQDAARSGEAGEAVDMVIRDVEIPDTRCPDDAVGAEGAAQLCFYLGTAQVRIAIVDDPGAFVRDQIAMAILIDAARFACQDSWRKFQAKSVRNAFGNPAVALVHLLVAPSVEVQ